MAKREKKSIKDLPKVERPREKLMHYGPGKLSNSELLAILLRSGRQGESALEMAGRILKKYGCDSLPHLSFDDLKACPGLGPAKACEIMSCFELGKRLLKEKKAALILSPHEVWNELRDIKNCKKEYFVVFYLDTRNQEIKREIISIGSLNASLIHPREVFEPAVKNLAAQIIVAHNHPSGDPEPSQDDAEVTDRLVEAGRILGIEVIDHVIITRDGFLSFRERGLV